jgi:O-antigen ligase
MISFVLKLKYRYPIALVCTYFVIISGSRGVLMSLVLFYLLFFSYQYLYERYIVRRYFKYVLIVSIISLTVFSHFIESVVYEQLHYVGNRFGERDKDDSILNRGYDRLYIYSEYVLLGYGEGGVDSGEKFSEALSPTIETHSTWANFTMSYGIIGLVLFSMMMLDSFEFKDYRYYVPFLVHGLIQVDSRQTTFWIFIFFIFIHNTEKKLADKRIRIAFDSQSKPQFN